ncbi:MAG: glycoside hydrolase family 3 protein, partial [Bacteroidales bacterium]|nr:glycoside hydrolase family 3 protein [Bacteroidales bacterium]
MKKLLPICIAALFVACAPSPEKRAADLVSMMSVEQKASLMLHPSEPVEELGIPSYNWWNEALHGVARNGKATTFPMPIGMAASFDDELLLDVFTAVSDEGRVKNRQALEAGHAGWYQGITYWTPNINIFRDPRWGRGMETYGEDPYLTGRMGIAVVRGLQGDPNAKVLKAHACAKHFAVHSGPEWNRHTFNAEVSERDLRETYLPAFKDLVTKAGVQEVMIAYNRFREEPCGVN